ncbi:MAG: hypothetical protein NVSMB49_27370 [Ktedonobacteraceae bacterium]
MSKPADGESPKAGKYRPRSVFLVDHRHLGIISHTHLRLELLDSESSKQQRSKE